MKKKVSNKKNILKDSILIIAIILILLIIILLCYGYYKKTTTKTENPIATIEVENFGNIKVELYPDMAENTVTNFINLANNGFYDGQTFHRIIKDFMIQGGDPNGDGTGGAKMSEVDSSIEKGSENDKEYAIDGEFIANDYKNNTLKLGKGVIAMARNDYSAYASYYGSSITKQGYNSASSQFFIMTTDENLSLTGNYAGFEKVIEGLDVLQKLAEVKVKQSEEEGAEESTPEEAPIIKSIKVETFGIDYGKPKTHEKFDLSNYMGINY